MRAQLSAQAKINLRLRILAREESGFHQLETLFLRLDLADTVLLRRTTGARSLDVTGAFEAAAIGPVERNLAWRAADAFLHATGTGGGFAIELEKRIPIGGGLGGGSADAAAVLRLANALAPRPLGRAALLDLASTLGADVPFLVSDLAFALAWGRGERLLGLSAPPARDVVLVVPPFGVNTAEAYGWLAASRERGARTSADDLLEAGALADWGGIAKVAVNDFEPVVAARHPVVRSVAHALRAGGLAPAMLSGSGSVVFGVSPEGGAEPPPLGESGCVLLRSRTATRVEPVELLD